MNPIVEQLNSLLKQKTLVAVNEERKRVAACVFDEELNEAAQHVDHSLAHDLADKAVYNHNQYHRGNHDDRNGGRAMHDLHTWSKNYAKKKAKGVYDPELAVKGLTHAIKNSESSYFGKKHNEKHGQHISGATRTQAARYLLPHVHALMAGKDVHDINESVSHLQEEPRKNTRMHDTIKSHGFEYTGTKNGFRQYKHPEGDEIRHKFPTTNGNHSFHHSSPTGKVVWKSPNTGDTEIQQHLEKHFPKRVHESVKRPHGYGLAGSGFSKHYRSQVSAERAHKRLTAAGYEASLVSHPNNPASMRHAVLVSRNKGPVNEIEINKLLSGIEEATPTLTKPATQPKAPETKRGRTGKWGDWSDDPKDRMPWPKDYAHRGSSSPLSGFSKYADVSEDHRVLGCCTACGKSNYVLPSGSTAVCNSKKCHGESTEHEPISWKTDKK